MRTKDGLNMASFDDAAARFRAEGHEVFCPTEEIRALKLEAVEWTKEIIYTFFMGFAFPHIKKADVIYMLKGWRQSWGACLEHDWARLLGKTIVYEDEAEAAA